MKNSMNDWILKKNYCKLPFLCIRIQQKTVVFFREKNNHIFVCEKNAHKNKMLRMLCNYMVYFDHLHDKFGNVFIAI